eukprot:911081-Rhodomonas_salina.2
MRFQGKPTGTFRLRDTSNLKFVYFLACLALCFAACEGTWGGAIESRQPSTRIDPAVFATAMRRHACFVPSFSIHQGSMCTHQAHSLRGVELFKFEHVRDDWPVTAVAAAPGVSGCVGQWGQAVKSVMQCAPRDTCVISRTKPRTIDATHSCIPLAHSLVATQTSSESVHGVPCM